MLTGGCRALAGLAASVDTGGCHQTQQPLGHRGLPCVVLWEAGLLVQGCDLVELVLCG